MWQPSTPVPTNRSNAATPGLLYEAVALPAETEPRQLTTVQIARSELTKPYAELLADDLVEDVLNEVELIRATNSEDGSKEPSSAWCSNFVKMAERAGFEPAMEFNPHTRLAGECLQPLGHLSLELPGARSLELAEQFRAKA
jgi:hypothetical protein